MTDGLVIRNHLGGVMVRRDNIPHTLHSRGLAPWPSKGVITDSGRSISNVPYSRINITGIQAPIIALRTRGDNDFVYGSTAYVDGKVYYHIFGPVSQQVEYFIFSQQQRQGGNSGLQVYKQGSSELAFDSSWPMMIPVGVYSVGRESTSSHNLGTHPAFIQLNQPMRGRSERKWEYDAQDRKYYWWATEGQTLALRVDGSTLKSGYISGIGNSTSGLLRPLGPKQSQNFNGTLGPDTLKALLINVSNL